VVGVIPHYCFTEDSKYIISNSGTTDYEGRVLSSDIALLNIDDGTYEMFTNTPDIHEIWPYLVEGTNVIIWPYRKEL
jgi:hypothetical protein